MKKAFIILLVGIMALFCFAGCNQPTKDPTKDSETATDRSEITQPEKIEDSGLPASLDFGDEYVKFLHRTSFKNELYATEEDKGTVDEAVFARNEYVQEQLNVEFQYVEVDEAYNQYAKMHNRILSSYLAGDEEVQIISGGAYYAPALVTQEVYYDMHVLNSSKTNYLNFEQKWWNAAFAEQAELFGKLFYATGDLTISVTKELEAMAYNKSLLNSYYPEADLLQEVYDGEWTYEKMLGYLTEVGNSEDSGVYGLAVMCDSGSIDGFLSGMDVDLMEIEDESLLVNINTDHNYEVVNKLRELYHDNPHVDSNGDTCNARFSGGQSIFYMGMILKEGGVLSKSDFDFYVIPSPKWDDNQEDYVVAPHDLYSCISVMNGVEDTDMISAVLELLAYRSYVKVRPALFENTYKYSYIGSEDGAKMFDFVLDHVSYNFMNIYSNVLGNVFWTLRDNVRYLSKNQLLTDLVNASSIAKANLETFLYAVEHSGGLA